MGQITEKWTAFVRSLGFRIALSVGLIVAASYVVLIYFIVDFQKAFFTDQMIQEAQTFSTAVLHATDHSMLKDDRATTANIVADLSLREEHSHIRIYNHEGVVKYAGQTRGDRRKSQQESGSVPRLPYRG